MEWLDICDREGRPTGKIVERSEAHAEGIHHRTAHVWIVRKREGEYEVLLQKRSRDKDSFPGCLDTSSAGHIPAGMEPLASAQRELFEELGIRAEEKELKSIGTFLISYETMFYGKVFRDEETAFVYLFEREIRSEELILQQSEVEAVVWCSLSDLLKRCDRKDPKVCVPVDGLHLVADHLWKRA